MQKSGIESGRPTPLTETDMTDTEGMGGRTIVILYNCRSDFMVLSIMTTSPPPSTVSIVRARRLGVIASKS